MKHLLGWLAILLCFPMSGQISGVVSDERGEPLPYASIYVQNSTRGTTTNAQGEYSLHLQPGRYDLVFQYVGYATQIINVVVPPEMQSLDIVLESESQLLEEVIVAANGEDPAYQVIRNAIARRSYYRNLTQSYVCDVYVKGNTQVLDAPEKILGFEVGDLEGMLDSNRQGMVYLSESVSKLYYKAPDRFKEVVTSSKISGDDQGYSFNSAREMEINFYDNTVDLNRNLVSPIAENALGYYRYKLLGRFLDENNRLINKIEVIPKRSVDPVFYGLIYITEDLWNIHSLELGTTAESTQVYFVDSLTINQVYVPLMKPDRWHLFSNTISFKLSGFGFVFAGVFTAVYSDYQIDPVLGERFFNREVHIVEKESNARDSVFWQAIRPVPLTVDEERDYVRKDSIQKVRNDPAYKDSLDRVNNRLTFGDFVGGYNFSRTRNNFYWNISSPLWALGYNTVQGFNSDVEFDVRKYFDEKETRRLLFFGNVNYGFAENKLRAGSRLIYRPSRMNQNQYLVGGGSDIVQFNRENPISSVFNTLYSELVRKNYAKYHGLKYVEAGIRRELFGGFNLRTHLRWEERIPLINNADFSFFNKDEIYTSNDPQRPDSYVPSFDKHQVVLVDLDASIRFGEEYVVYPDRRFITGRQGPRWRIHYQLGLPVSGSETQFQKLSLSIDDLVSTGVAGELRYHLGGGVLFGKEKLQFMDYFHFLGTQTFFTTEDDYHRRFLLLPYYTYSTNQSYVEFHLQHEFDGFILDKIPGINRLGFGLVGGIKLLHSKGHPFYQEIHLGLDKIGYHMARIFRIDLIYGRRKGYSEWGIRFALKN